MESGEQANVIFTWTAHPAKQHVGRGVLGLVVISAAGFGVALLANHPLAGVMGGLLLVLSLQKFFFPSQYTLNEEGLTAKTLLNTKRLRWSDVRRFVFDADGGYFSTRARASWLDAYRGVHVMWGHQREQAVRAVQSRLAVQRVAASASESGDASPSKAPSPGAAASGASA